jgi:glycosyltransferase involved in cell wall biosynthesis
MNILFNNATTSWAGIKTWMIELATFLQAKGHRPLIVCRNKDLLIEKCRERNLECLPIQYGADYSPFALRKFFRIFRDHGTELVITNISKGIRTAGVAARLKKIPHINRVGNYGDLKATAKVKWEYTKLIDKVIVPSQALYNHFVEKEFLKDKLRMFHNAVKAPPFVEKNNAVLKFAVVANLSERKQVDKIIEAFAHLTDLSWEFYVGGFGPELESLKTLVSQLGLEERIFFLGRVDPVAFLSDKDVGLLYSYQEAFGWSIIEYMASSCAVIASHIGGIPEIITDKNQGILVNPQQQVSLIEALRACLTDRSRVEQLARGGYQRVQEAFNQETIFSAIEKEFQLTIDQNRNDKQ